MKKYIYIAILLSGYLTIYAQDSSMIYSYSETDRIDRSISERQYETDVIELEKFSGVLFGISAGLNISTRLYDYKINPTPPPGSFLLGPSAGILLGYQFSKLFSIQSFLKYQIKGDKIDVSRWLDEFESPPTVNAVWEIESSGSVTTTLHYIEASLLPVFGIGNFHNGVQIQIGAGGFAAYGIAGKEINDYSFKYYLDYEFDSEDIIYEERQVEFVTFIPSTFSDEFRYFNSLDYGLLFYGGLRYNKINIGINYTRGMKQLEYNSFNFGYWTQPKDITKTATTTFALTYIF